MNAKEVNKRIDSPSESDWERMKNHLDKKFPNMAMKDMESFKLLVQIFGMEMESKEGKLN